MKRLFILTSLTALLTLSSTLLAQEAHKIWEPPYTHGIAAAVEDSIITYEELRRELLPLVPRVREGTGSNAEFDKQMTELYFEVLQSLVDRILIMKDFQTKEFNLPPSVIENEFDKVLFEDFDNDRAKFHDFLKSQGKNVREFRRELYEQIIVSIMRSQKQRTAAQISPERIENFYNENKLHFYEDEAVKLRIITMRPIAGESSDLMRQNIEKVIAEIDSGTPFEEVAKEYSQDSRRDRGGDWGWIQRGDLKEELAEHAFSLGVGEHSDPIKIDSQTMIVFVEDYREEGIQDLVEVRENIEEILSSQLGRQTQEQWLERLRKKAYIRYF